MAGFRGKFESVKQEWPTPDNLYSHLHNEFKFNTDLASDVFNTKCRNFFTKEHDALKQKWQGNCWLNPPYGDGSIGKWVNKAYMECWNEDTVIVMLIPARTNTKWFHECCMRSDEVRFILGRPKFGEAAHGLPQPLAIIVFGNKVRDFHLRGKPYETKFSSLDLRRIQK